MNPKDMTHVELLSEAMASMLDIGACYEGLEQERADSDVIRVELLRRLDEADALRKENEELRKDKARLDRFDNLPKEAAFVIAADVAGVTYIIADSSRPIRESLDIASDKQKESSHD